MPRFYIATGLKNRERARELAKLIEALPEDGWRKQRWECAFPWWEHQGDVNDYRNLRMVAGNELHGVVNADVVIILLPGARGTHTEFGAALAWNKVVIIWSDTGRDFDAGWGACTFYHLRSVTRCTPASMGGSVPKLDERYDPEGTAYAQNRMWAQQIYEALRHHNVMRIRKVLPEEAGASMKERVGEQ